MAIDQNISKYVVSSIINLGNYLKQIELVFFHFIAIFQPYICGFFHFLPADHQDDPLYRSIILYTHHIAIIYQLYSHHNIAIIYSLPEMTMFPKNARHGHLHHGHGCGDPERRHHSEHREHLHHHGPGQRRLGLRGWVEKRGKIRGTSLMGKWEHHL